MTFNNFHAKSHYLLSKILPNTLFSLLKELFYLIKTKRRNVHLKTLDQTKGFFNVSLPNLSRSPEYFLNLENQTEYELFINGPPSPDYPVLVEQLKKGNIFYDIGSYIGGLTIPAAYLTGPYGLVIAFEPYKPTLERLEKTLIKNNLNNVLTLEYALGADNNEAQLHLSDNPSTHTIVRASTENFFLGTHEQTEAYCQVQIESLDNLIDTFGLPQPDFIKIDVEGAEVNVLNGMLQTLTRNQPHVLISVHENKLLSDDSNVRELYEIIDDLPHTPQYLKQDGSTTSIKSPPLESLYELLLVPS